LYACIPIHQKNSHGVLRLTVVPKSHLQRPVTICLMDLSDRLKSRLSKSQREVGDAPAVDQELLRDPTDESLSIEMCLVLRPSGNQRFIREAKRKVITEENLKNATQAERKLTRDCRHRNRDDTPTQIRRVDWTGGNWKKLQEAMITLSMMPTAGTSEGRRGGRQEDIPRRNEDPDIRVIYELQMVLLL